MTRFTRLIAALIACLAGANALAAALTADEIIANHVRARGGKDKLIAIQGLERVGRLIVPGFNGQLDVRDLKTRAGEYRQEVTLQGMTQVQAYDGHQAWQVQPFQGRKDPSLMSADEAKGLALSADIDFPLVDYRKKGHTVEYLGVEDIDGTAAHKLRVTLKSGNESTFWLDPDSWMVIRELDRQTIRGAEQLIETDFGEYEAVAGVYVPMSEAAGAKDSDAAQKQKIVYEKAVANPTLPPSEFTFPVAAAPAVQQ